MVSFIKEVKEIKAKDSVGRERRRERIDKMPKSQRGNS